MHRNQLKLVLMGLALAGSLQLTHAIPLPAAHGYLGVGLADAPQGAPSAARVGELDPQGPAAQAGLRSGDLIRAVNGHPVKSGQELQTYVLAMPPGAVLNFDVLRRGSSGYQSIKISATLNAGHGQPAPTANINPSHNLPAAPPPSKPGPPVNVSNVHYSTYTDPAEHAFTVQVPSGWRVGGRMMRYGPINIAPFAQALTPDGSIFVQIGDWRIKDYSDVPGFRQGALYYPGMLVMVVRRFQSAQQYARSYSGEFAKQLGCGNVSFTGSESPANPVPATVPQARLDTSLVEFHCTRSGQNFSGRVTVSHQSYRIVNTIGWDVLYLACLLARDDQSAAGVAVWHKMRSSFRFDSNWNAQQGRVATAATRPAQAALDATLRQSQAFDQHVINGEITVSDPTTGARSDIRMGAEPYYFSDGLGHFYNSYDPAPRSGFHSVNPAQ